MDKLIKTYEADIKAIDNRINELRATGGIRSPETKKRIELLYTERLELMYCAAKMRRFIMPKPPSPVYRSGKTVNAGDAAC